MRDEDLLRDARRRERAGDRQGAKLLLGAVIAGGRRRLAARAAFQLAILTGDSGALDDAERLGTGAVLFDVAARRAALGQTAAAKRIYERLLADPTAPTPTDAALAAFRLAHLHLEQSRVQDAVALLRDAAIHADEQ